MVVDLEKIILKYPEMHLRKEIVEVEGYESFVTAPDTQWCGPVKIVFDLPYTEFFFSRGDAALGLRAIAWKTYGGLCKIDVEIYVNGIYFDHKALDFEKTFFNLIKNENKVFFSHLNSINYTYSKQIYMYPVKFEGDTSLGGIDWSYPNKW